MAEQHTLQFKGHEITVTQQELEDAFDATSSGFNELGYSPWVHLEHEGERKPAKDVFRNLDVVKEVLAELGDDVRFGPGYPCRLARNIDGFAVYDKRGKAAELLKGAFQEALDIYDDTVNRSEKHSSDERLAEVVGKKAKNLVKHLVLKQDEFDRSDFSFDASAGTGYWTEVPWVAVFHNEETSTSREGIYVVYLIDPSRDVVFLTLNQGVTEIKQEKGKPAAREHLRETAEEVRAEIELPGFEAEELEFDTNNIAELYGPGTIFYKEYSLNETPDQMEEDLRRLVKAYKLYIEGEGSRVEMGEAPYEKDSNLVKEPSLDIETDLDIGITASDFEDELYFPNDQDEELAAQISSALNAGKHIIFTGPPGTGKTELSEIVGKKVTKEEDEKVTGYQVTTATSDWSTFDTVGGYMPEKESGGDLEFNPGFVLERLPGGDHPNRNQLLVIDEINRADIDKAFGQLFTVLSGQEVSLPFEAGEDGDEQEITITPADEHDGSIEEHEYVVPESWRILATMNTYDKTSLYEMSYAFMRRFAFIRVDAPDLDQLEDDGLVELLEEYNEVWGIDIDEDEFEAVGKIWQAMNTGSERRKIGPAIVQDMLQTIGQRLKADEDADRERLRTEAVVSYILPQLEGVRKNDDIVRSIIDTDVVDDDRLKRVAGDMLQVTIDEQD